MDYENKIICGDWIEVMKDWPDKRYRIIYADPPWKYKDSLGSQSAKMGACEYHYPVLSIREIAALPVADIADTHCVLFLWVTMPKLQECFQVIQAWGFTYKTVAFVWIKLNPKAKTIFRGIGRWVQGNAELVLLCTRGRPKRVSKRISQIVIAERGRHSAKPTEVRSRIVELMGNQSRIELFARKEDMLFDAHAFGGWDVWGNEV